MASKKPLVVSSEIEQLQAGDTLTVGDYDIPNAIGANGTVLQVDAGAATWGAFTGSFLGDTDYYVSITGNDADDGSVGNPWETLKHAAEEIHKVQFEQDALVTIYLSDGVHTLADTVEILHSAPRILITGETESLTHNITDLDNVNAIGGGIYDCQLSVGNTTGLTNSMYVGIIGSSKRYMDGAWEIRTIDDVTHITIRVESPVVVPFASAFSHSLRIPQTILIAEGDDGFWVEGTGVQFEHLTLIANGAANGIRAHTCYNIVIGEQVLINGFTTGVYITSGAVNTDNLYVSQCATNIRASYYGVISFNNSVVSAASSYGIRADSGRATISNSSINGNTNGLYALSRGMLYVTDTDIHGNVTGITVWNMSYCRARTSDGVTFNFNTADYSPGGGGEGNRNSYLHI